MGNTLLRYFQLRMCLEMLPTKFPFKQLQVIWYYVINSIIHRGWKMLLIVTKVLSTCTWLVLEWKSTWCTWCLPSILSTWTCTCTCKYEKYLYLTQVLRKVLDPNPGVEYILRGRGSSSGNDELTTGLIVTNMKNAVFLVLSAIVCPKVLTFLWPCTYQTLFMIH